MAVKPTSKLAWIPSDDPTKINEPTTALKNAGFIATQKPTHQFFNWFLNLSGKWFDYFEETTDDLAELSESIEGKLDAPGATGTANQFLARNAAGNAMEWKSWAATGPITLTHAVGLVTIAMPPASGDAAGYVTTGTQDIGGDKYFLDDVSIDGNLTVAGSLAYLNVESLQVEDKNIDLNYGSTTAAAPGSGVTVRGDANASLATVLYDSTLTSKWKLGATGAEAEIQTLTHTQTVSNKTLNNTNTIAARDDRFTIEDPADATKKIRIDAGNITTAQTRVINMPDADATLLGASTTQVVTNKDFDGGTASNTSRLTLPKNTLTNLTALTRKEATLVYGSDTDLVYFDDGASLIPLPKPGKQKGYVAGTAIAAGDVGEKLELGGTGAYANIGISSGATTYSETLTTNLTAGVWFLIPWVYLDEIAGGTIYGTAIRIQYYNGSTWVNCDASGRSWYLPLANIADTLAGPPIYFNHATSRQLRMAFQPYGLNGAGYAYYCGVTAVRIE